MYKVAIVDDEIEQAQNLINCFTEYTKETGEGFNVVHFKDGVTFLETYTNDFDIVFMDIDMPYITGLQTAKELRKRDDAVVLIFITVLAKYAIKGYEFDAIDYVLKPLNYNSFKVKIKRAMQYSDRRQKQYISLPISGKSPLRVDLASLYYVEIENHNVVYHTENGNFSTYGTILGVEKMLPEKQFFKCNRCYIVNLRNVTNVGSDYVSIGETRLPMSRARKKDFVEALNEYYSSHKA